MTAAQTEKSAAPARGLQKAAIALIALGPKASASILRHMPEDEVERLSSAIARIPSVDPSLSESVLNEARVALTGRRFYLAGGLDYARKMLEEAFGREMANDTVDRLSRALAGEESHFEHLSKVDPQQLAKLLQDEHPQAIVVILSRLLPAQAAAVLSHLPKESLVDILRRMAALDQISPEVVRIVSQVVRQKLNAFGEFSREACGGVKSVADICNRLDPTLSTQALEAIEGEDPELSENVRRLMFVFEDLIRVDANSLRELIAHVDKKLLTTALKGTSPELQNHILGQMSSRAADMMREDMVALGPVKLREVDAAQQEIIALARTLERESGLTLTTSGGGDEGYVE